MFTPQVRYQQFESSNGTNKIVQGQSTQQQYTQSLSQTKRTDQVLSNRKVSQDVAVDMQRMQSGYQLKETNPQVIKTQSLQRQVSPRVQQQYLQMSPNGQQIMSQQQTSEFQGLQYQGTTPEKYNMVTKDEINWMQKGLFYEQRVKELELKIEQLLIEIDRLSSFINQKGNELEKWKSLYQDLESQKTEQLHQLAIVDELRTKYLSTQQDKDKYSHQIMVLSHQLEEVSSVLRSKNEELDQYKYRLNIQVDKGQFETEIVRLKSIIEQKNRDFEQVRLIQMQLQQQLQSYESKSKFNDNSSTLELQIETLRQQLRFKDEQIRNQDEQLASLTYQQGSKSSKLEMELQLLQQQLLQKDQQLSIVSKSDQSESLQKELLQLKRKYEEQVQVADQYRRKFESVSTDYQSIQTSVKQYQSSSNNEVEQLRNELQQSKLRFEQLSQEYQRVQITIKQSESSKSSETQSLRDELNKMKLMTEKLNEKLQRAQSTIEEYEVRGQQETVVLREELQKTRYKYEQLTAENQRIQITVQQFESKSSSEAEQLRAELQKARYISQQLEQQITSIQGSSQVELESLRSEITKYKTKYQSIEQQSSSATSQLKLELENTKGELQKYRVKCQNLEQQQVTINEQRNQQISIQIESMGTDLKRKEQELQELKLKEIKWQVQISTAQEQLEQYKRQVTELQRRYDEQVSQTETYKSKFQSLGTEFQNLQIVVKRSEASTRDIETFRQEIIRLKQKCQMLEQDNLQIAELKSQLFQQQLELASNGLRRKDQEIQELKMKFQSDHQQMISNEKSEIVVSQVGYQNYDRNYRDQNTYISTTPTYSENLVISSYERPSEKVSQKVDRNYTQTTNYENQRTPSYWIEETTKTENKTEFNNAKDLFEDMKFNQQSWTDRRVGTDRIVTKDYTFSENVKPQQQQSQFAWMENNQRDDDLEIQRNFMDGGTTVKYTKVVDSYVQQDDSEPLTFFGKFTGGREIKQEIMNRQGTDRNFQDYLKISP